MTTYLLRDVDPDLWVRVKVRAAQERRPIRDVLIELLRDYGAGRVQRKKGRRVRG